MKYFVLLLVVALVFAEEQDKAKQAQDQRSRQQRQHDQDQQNRQALDLLNDCQAQQCNIKGNHRIRLQDGRVQLVEFTGKVDKVTNQENQPEDQQDQQNRQNHQDQNQDQNQQNRNQQNQGMIRGQHRIELPDGRAQNVEFNNGQVNRLSIEKKA